MERFSDFGGDEEGGDWDQASGVGSESVVSTERCSCVW
jgi:hypothetical protein